MQSLQESKKYKSIIKKKKKKHDKIVLLRKTKLDIVEVLISKALIDSYISYDEFVSVNNVLREHNEIKKKEKILKLLWNILCKNNGKVLHQLSCKKYTANEHLSVRKSNQKGLMLL